jgi:hypothetical protein
LLKTSRFVRQSKIFRKKAKLNQKTVFDAKKIIEAKIALMEDAFLKKGLLFWPNSKAETFL